MTLRPIRAALEAQLSHANPAYWESLQRFVLGRITRNTVGGS